MFITKINTYLNTRTISLVVAVLLCVAIVLAQSRVVLANTEDKLRSETAQLEKDITKNKKEVNRLADEGETLKDKIKQLKLEVDVANQQIEVLSLKVEALEQEVVQAEDELERQKLLLANSMRELYKQGNLTTVEMLASSSDFSDFVNQQEYLQRLKDGIQVSAGEVAKLKEQLEADKLEQESLLAQQQGQRDVLKQKTAEQKTLLAETEGEEKEYQKTVASLEKQRQEAEQELQNVIAERIREAAAAAAARTAAAAAASTGSGGSANVPVDTASSGYVTQGTAIGTVGSTGFSTGPHLHFAITDGTTFFDPGTYGALTYGMSWPLPNSGAGSISQAFGCVAAAGFYATSCNGGANSLHTGLDISGWYGDPVVAAKDGLIVFSGWLGGYGNTIIIDHGDGIYTYYPHMQ